MQGGGYHAPKKSTLLRDQETRGLELHSEKKAPMPVGGWKDLPHFLRSTCFGHRLRHCPAHLSLRGLRHRFWKCRLDRFRCRTGCADRRPGWFRTVALWVRATAGEPLAFCEKRMVAGSNSRKSPLSSASKAGAGGRDQPCILGTDRGTHRPSPSSSAPSVHRLRRHSCTSS